MQLFSSDFYVGNRQRLLTEVKADLLVVSANAMLQKSADAAYPFQQDTGFWYLTGCAEPETVLVADSKGGSYLILPPSNDYRRIFDGQGDAAAAAQVSGVDAVYDHEVGWKKLTAQLKKAKSVATCLPADDYIEIYAMYANPARRALHNKLVALLPAGFEPIDARPALARQRSVKQLPEVKAIQRAINSSIAAFEDEIIKAKQPFGHEYEIEAALGYGFRRTGADGHAYSPIVAVGENACTLHYEKNQDQLKKGKLLLIDAGASYQGYAADITRMYSMGKPTKRQLEVFKAVQQVQHQLIAQLKPGKIFKEFLFEAEYMVGRQLKKLGLITDTSRESIREFYPHSTSHFLGLDPHDPGDYEQALQPGMVVTVEPGIYIPSEKIGVRIEDDILITKTGSRNLSAALTTDLIELPVSR